DREGTELVSFATTAEEFAKQIELEVARDNGERADERRRFARRNTWTSRFAQLADAIRPLYPRVSVVVLTYNNLELTKLCVESILRNTRWPNFELIIVDNASHDGTPDYLHEVARE